MRPLRYYQEDAVAATLDTLKAVNKALVVMATGLGKTECFAELCRITPGRCLVLVDRDELVTQAVERVEGRLGDEPVQIEQATLRASHFSRVVVASTRSMMNRLDFWPREHFELVIIDEVDCYIAPGYRRVVEHFQGKRVGFTATPDRGDKKGLRPLFPEDQMVVRDGCMDLFEAIESGFLVPVKARRTTIEEINLDAVRAVGGDFVRGELDREMVKAMLGIVERLMEQEGERKGIIFTPGVESAEVAYHALLSHLVPACFLRDKMSKEERREQIELFRKGLNYWLSNCMVATRGFDAPLTGCIGFGRPTKSRNLMAQMVGRGTRIFPGCVDNLLGRDEAAARREAIAASPKPDCMLRDFVGNTKHALVGPEDILGDFSEAERKEAKKIVKEKPGADVRESLIAARERLKRAISQVKLKVKATDSDVFDPFAMIGLRFAPSARKHNGWGRPITPGLVQALENIGLEKEYVRSLSLKAAGSLMTEFKSRIERNLISYKMLKLLRQFGVDDFNLPFDKGREACRYIAQECNYGKRKPVDPKALNSLLYGVAA